MPMRTTHMKTLLLGAAAAVFAVALIVAASITTEKIDPTRPTAGDPSPSAAPAQPQAPASTESSVPR